MPIERATTPPASWYVREELLEHERDTVFRRGWVFACRTDQVREPGACVAADVLGDAYLVVRGSDGELRAFHNVCRHHAARLVGEEACVDALVCPYHGWTYSLDGRLKSAPRSAGMEGLGTDALGLVRVHVEVWGPLVFVHAGEPRESLAAQLAELAPLLDPKECAGLRWVFRRRYPMRCNWKVFVDNYLDGGYHIAHLHKGLASQLDLATYRTRVFERFNVQTCDAHREPGVELGRDLRARIGDGAVYAWLYPNLMLNRYGPTLDTNLVLPVGVDRCEVVFDYWFDGTAEEAEAFVQDSIETSDETQQEDVWISEQVQRGLASPAYDRGRYAPEVEHGMHHFHRLLAADLAATR
ncbi:MAG: aromatic ring-hydroxylating dioxygenase subunit alpha [Planctomycetota bacterium]